MKRIFLLFLVLLMVTTGCGVKEQAQFYYCQLEYSYESHESMIVSEKRDIQGYTDDLPFLISLYLMGPLDKEYACPFPKGTKLMNSTLENQILTLRLTDTPNLSDAQYSLACACMALTCLDLCDATTVTIKSGNRSITIDPAMLTLNDNEIPTQDTNGGTQ